MIFAREISDPLTSLVKKIDAATQKNSSCRMGSFVVFLNDEEGLADKLKEFNNKANLKKTVLTIDNPAGPKAYRISKDADVTVLLYNRHTVRANHAFRSGELDSKAINQIINDLKKILPEDE